MLSVVAVWLTACGGTGTVGFERAEVGVDENQPAVVLTVRRSGGTRGSASVRFASADGAAKAGEDYVATAGTLEWPAGEGGAKQIRVPLLDDALAEDDETFSLRLDVPQGATPGARTQATVTIHDDEPLPVQVLALNDFHGYLNPPPGAVRARDPARAGAVVELPAGGVAYLATQIAQLRAGHTRSLLVAAGDLVGASPLESSLFHDEPAVAAMNALGLRYSAVGNHEFDDGRAELRRLQSGGCLPGDASGEAAASCRDGAFAGARFQYLAANVIDEATAQPLFPGYAIERFDAGDGRTLGLAFIGAVLRDVPDIVERRGIDGLRFLDEAQAINALVPKIRSEGVDAIVLLIHEGAVNHGLYDDRDCGALSGDLLPILDRLDPAINVVVSGHTHSAYACTVGGRVLTSAGAYGRLLTELELAIDRVTRRLLVRGVVNHVVVNDRAPNPAPQAYPTLAPEPAMQARVAAWTARVAPLAERTVGRIGADLMREAAAPRALESGEWVLGDVIADAQLAATRAPDAGGAMVALTNPGGIRNDLPMTPARGALAAGSVSYGAAFAVQPFGNTLVTMTLSGTQLRDLLEQQFPPAQPWPRVLQVSAGLHYTYDARAASGARVDAASLTLDGEPVQPDRRYRVTVNSFLAGGGDGFSVLEQGSERVGGITDIEAFTRYLAANVPLSPPATDRIRRTR